MVNPEMPMPRLRTNLSIITADDLGMTSSCISCISFHELGGEICDKFNARPPARIIAHGCKEYFDKEEIPF